MAMRFDAGEIITAMITPMDKDRKVDYKALEKLVEHLIATGTESILVAGTTGESPTLTHDEEVEIFRFVKKVANGRAKLIMGAGSNCTQTAVMATNNAKECGADAILSVVPYYNKPSQKGLIEHFSTIAKSTDLPVLLYNIPGRTGITMQPETIAHLAKEHKNIFAVKQSLADMDVITETRRLCPDDFVIYSGDDSLTLPMVSVGAHGVISVASHIIGNQMHEMLNLYKSGKVKEATDMHLKLYPLFKKIFMAPNPVPVKECLKKMGIIENYVRRPLVELDEGERNELYSVLEQYI
ncbi:MAG: 4-hydroxy-tetrahydrodipicolinate synthase [Clostridium sp.]|nr:4-hydroxy-tetrahydrodipicolinate synthase [Clostridium sp.]